MKRSELIKEASIKSGLSQKEVKSVINVVTDIVIDELVSGNEVKIDGLGCFYTKEYARHKIKTFDGTYRYLDARPSPRFSPSKHLKEAVKERKK